MGGRCWTGWWRRTAAVSAICSQTLAGVRPLEFYMPVRKHRESWTGNGEVLVVSQLDESEPIVAFDAKGRCNSRSIETAPPEQPTLSIVPVETRFDQPMPSASKNVGDQNGNAIGTLEPMAIKGSSLIACGDGMRWRWWWRWSAPPSIAPGLYLEFSRILDIEGAVDSWRAGDRGPHSGAEEYRLTDIGGRSLVFGRARLPVPKGLQSG